MKTSMILFGILLVIGVTCQGREVYPEEIEQNIKTCTAEFGITEEENEEAMRDNNFSSPKFRCMSECVLRISEIMIEKEINLENLKKFTTEMHPEISEEQIEKLNEKCLEEAEGIEDKCDFTFKYQMCLLAAIHKE